MNEIRTKLVHCNRSSRKLYRRAEYYIRFSISLQLIHRKSFWPWVFSMQSLSRHGLPLFLVLTKCDLSVRALISCISLPTYVATFDIREGAITVIVAEAKCLVRRRRPPPWERWKPNELPNNKMEINLNTCRWWRGSTPSTCTRGCMVSASSTRLLGLWRFVHHKSWPASYVLSHKSGDQEVCREADGH